MVSNEAAESGRRFYFCRLIPPRPTFATDMTSAEAEVMQAHVVYWTDLARRGVAIVFGPVADPAGAWGLGVIATESDEALMNLQREDPAIVAGIGMRYEALPMPAVVTGALA